MKWNGSTKSRRCCSKICIPKCSAVEISKLRATNLGQYERVLDCEGRDSKKRAVKRGRDGGRDYKKMPLIDKLAQSRVLFQKVFTLQEYPGSGVFQFRVGKNIVCATAWAVCNGFSHNTVGKTVTDIRKGVLVPSVRYVVKDGNSPSMECLKKLRSPSPGKKTSTVVEWVLKQAQESSDKMPKGGRVRLPHMSLISLFECFNGSKKHCTIGRNSEFMGGAMDFEVLG